MQTKLVLDQKWGVLYNGNGKMTIWLKASWKATIFGSRFKKCFLFVCKRSFKAWNAPKYWCVYNGFDYNKVWCLNFHCKFFFFKNWLLWEKMNLDEKWNFEIKNSFFIKFQESTKNEQKKFNFFKKKKLKLYFALKWLLFVVNLFQN